MLYTRRCILLAFIYFMGLHIFYSCKKTDVVRETSGNPNTNDPFLALNLLPTPYNYANQSLPGYFLSPPVKEQDNTPATNPMTDWGATLGRVLFYDKTLSINNAVACANCHKQSHSFADDKAFSVGFAGELTLRNSMSLVNVKYYRNGRFLWDERGSALETQTLLPVLDHVEMGMTNLDTLVNRLKTKAYYPALFHKAFDTQLVTSEKIGDALAQFIRSIISYKSKFDQGRSLINSLRSPYPNFTQQENEGKLLFLNPRLGCNSCHKTETFTAPMPKNNGLEIPSVDLGVGGISNDPSQAGNFKISSLKNVELTAPYMHDGRFATLEEVIEHYNSGVQPHPNLPGQLRNPDNTPVRLNLTVDEKKALVAFLKTLTDRSITTDVKFSNPFK
ncbi:MAG TPA: cytochrome c peroxidase [Chitinophagaceae bacterium]|nr:cytochrome c peroxidase [Chitinophagaceae bacterium]